MRSSSVSMLFAYDGAYTVSKGFFVHRSLLPLADTRQVGHLLGIQISQNANADIQALVVPLQKLVKDLA